MSMMNYPAFFVTLTTIFLLIVHTIAPFSVLALAFATLAALTITASTFTYLEGHLHQDQ